MKKLLRTFAIYAVITVIGMGLLSALAHLHILRNAVYIYYYRMLYYAVIAHTLMLAVYALGQLIFARGKKAASGALSPVTFISGLIISALFCALFITAGPMPMDRSYSIYSVAEMSQHPDQVYSREEIEDAFYKGYILQNGATFRRIQEQLSIGNFEKVGENQYRITDKGRRLIAIMRLVEKFYPVDEKRTLYPGSE
jgi:hypothetical protein